MRTIKEKTAAMRRQHIIEAAIKVLADKGFHRATIRDVAREAGVADGTIYNVFQNKSTLLLGVLDPLDASNTPVPPCISRNVESLISQLLERRWDTFTPETLQILRIVLSEAMTNEELRQLFMERMIAPMIDMSTSPLGAAAGKHVQADAPLLLRGVTAMVIGLVMLRLLGEELTESKWDEFPAYIGKLLAEGLLPRNAGEGDVRG